MSFDDKVKELYNIEDGFQLISEMVKETLETTGRTPLIEKRKNSDGTMSLTLQAIPEIDVTELGWTDVRTEGNQEVVGPARQQLLQFMQNIRGNDLSEKVQSLSDFYSNPESLNLSGASRGERISSVLSYLVFYKTLTKVISNFNAASAGFNFEAFLAVLLGGEQIKANMGTIADFTTQDKTPISLKLYNEKSVLVG